MKKWMGAFFTSAAVALGGCAGTPQQNIDLAPGSLSAQSGRIGIAMTPMPKVDTMFPGADCLLCMATTAVANATLTSYTQTLPVDDLTRLPQEAADLLRKKGVNVIVLGEAIQLDSLPDWNTASPNVAKKDFSSIKKKYGVDKLLVMEVNTLGIWRHYSSYFPTGEPYAILQGAGYLVNLNNNTYEWYSRIRNAKTSEGGKWDEPPAFPGLTNAYFQVIENSKDMYLKPFKN